MRSVILFLLCAVPMLAVRGDETAPGPAPVIEPTIVLPMKVTTEESSSVTTREEVIDSVPVGVWYVIVSKTKLFVLDAPLGSVSIISGPASVDGVFADGTGKPETRVFDPEKHTYLIQGLKPCKTELILIPVGVTDRTAIVRQMLTVTGPNPPPDVDPVVPDPVVPDPVEPEKPKSFRVVFVKESGATLPLGQTSIPGAKVIRDYLNAKATPEGGLPGWREFDPDQTMENEAETIQKLWAAVKPQLLPAPCLVIEKNGHATVMPFPANVDECMKTLKKFGGD